MIQINNFQIVRSFHPDALSLNEKMYRVYYEFERTMVHGTLRTCIDFVTGFANKNLIK